MQEKLDLLLVEDLIKIAQKLEINTQVSKLVLIGNIDSALKNKNDEEQYKLFKEIFSQGKCDFVLFKINNTQTIEDKIIYPEDKDSLFDEPIRLYFNFNGNNFACCIKKHLSNSSMTISQARKIVNNDGFKVVIYITASKPQDIFKKFIKNDELRSSFDFGNIKTKTTIFYSSHSTSNEFLSTNCRLSASNEKISKNNDDCGQKNTDELNII